jgi:hypothetical protein
MDFREIKRFRIIRLRILDCGLRILFELGMKEFQEIKDAEVPFLDKKIKFLRLDFLKFLRS